ncbi:MAG: TetR/AcrR family transcriptional regulator, partial [Alphaproteobacteria bacterium]|nr:TetR/AcrR family transcriptional regulator [Alphaproteobacteria bacterium]
MQKLATKGRPREFDIETALGAALRVFWTKGYEGASLTELTEAMGVTRPSLYAAFGNKEALFSQALDLYEKDKLAYIGQAIEQPTARAVAEYMLSGAIDTATGGECRGCMGVIASVACQSVEPSIRDDVNRRAQSSKDAIVARMQQAV